MESHMKLASNKNSIRLPSGLCNLSVIPRLFTIKTTTNFSNFNDLILLRSSSVIHKFLKDNPTEQQYNLDIEDKKNVLIKIGDIFQGKDVKFCMDEFETCRLISNKLNIAGFSDFINNKLIKQSSIINTQNLIWGSLRGANSQQLQSNDYFEYTDNNIKLNEKKLSLYILNSSHCSFTIQTKKKEYKCNIFSVNYSSLIHEVNEKKWKNDFYFFDFEDENCEFQFICDLFNYEEVTLTNSNVDIIKEMAENLGIDIIIPYLDEYIKSIEKVSQSIDDQQTIIDSIDDLFDLLYHIKEKTVDYVANIIHDSKWSQSKDNICELSSFIIQVALTKIELHQYLIDLLIKLNEEDEKTNNFKIMIPFIINNSMKLFSKKIQENEDNLIFPFVFYLYKKGLIQKEKLYDEIKNCDFQNTLFISWFLPELNEVNNNINRIDFKTNYIIPKNNSNIKSTNFNQKRYFNAKQFYSSTASNIEEYIQMRDKGEIDDAITKALRNDDVDTFQSIVSNNAEKMLKNSVKTNMFEPFIGQNTRYLNYAAAYGSLKCFKYLLLNNEKVDISTFESSIIGGNIELIRIVYNEKIENPKTKKNQSEKSLMNEQMILKSLIITIKMHKNDLFDWIFEHKLDIIQSNSNMFSLITISVENCNPHSFVRIIDNGFDFNNCLNSCSQLMLIISHRKYYSLALFIINLINVKLDSKISTDILSNCIEIDSKDVLFYIIDKINSMYPLTIDSLYQILDRTYTVKNIEAYKKIAKIIFDNTSKSDNNFTSLFIKAILCDLKELVDDFIENKYPKNNYHLAEKISHNGKINSEIFISLINDVDIDSKKIMMQCINEAIISENKPLIEYLLKENALLDDALFRAVETGDLEIVEMILQKNSKPSFINKTSENGTALYLAVQNDNLKIVERLLAIPGIDPSIASKKYFTPLTLSAIKFKNEIFDCIVNFYGDEINKQKWQLENAIKFIIKKYPSLVYINNNSNNRKFFIKSNNINNNANSNLLDKKFENVTNFLTKIIQLNCIDPNLRFVIYSDQKASNNYTNKSNDQSNQSKYISLLLYACKIKAIDVVKTLIKYESIDLNIFDPETGNTALITAIENQDIKTAELLINHPKMNINIQNYEGKSALMFAILFNQNNIVDLLLNNEKFDPSESNINLVFYTSCSKRLLTCKSLDVTYVPLKNSNSIKVDNLAITKSPFIRSIIDNDLELFDLIVQHPSFIKYKTQIINAILVALKFIKDKFIQKLVELLKEFNIDVNSPVFNRKCLLIKAMMANVNDKTISSILNCPNFDSKKSDILKAFKLTYSYFVRQKDQKKSDINRSTSMEKIKIMDILYEYDNNHDHLIDLKGSSLLSDIYKSIFIDNNIDPNTKDKSNNCYPLEYAIKNDLYVLSLSLINSKQIDFNKNIDYSSYLHLAVGFDRDKILDQILSQNSCDVNIEIKDGETPLIEACRKQKAKCIKILFKSDDLDFLHKNKKDEDALQILSKLCFQKKSSTEKIKNKDEYLAKLLDLVEKIQSKYVNVSKIKNQKQLESTKSKTKNPFQSDSKTKNSFQSDSKTKNSFQSDSKTKNSFQSDSKVLNSFQSDSKSPKNSDIKDKAVNSKQLEPESTTKISNEKTSELKIMNSIQPESKAQTISIGEKNLLKINSELNSIQSKQIESKILEISNSKTNQSNEINSNTKEFHESNNSTASNLNQISETNLLKSKFKIHHESFTEKANPFHQYLQKNTQTDNSMKTENQKSKKETFKEILTGSKIKKNRKVTKSTFSTRKRKRKASELYDYYFDEEEFNQNPFYEQQHQDQTQLLLLQQQQQQQQQQQWFQMIQINNELQAQINFQMMNQIRMNKQKQQRLRKNKK